MSRNFNEKIDISQTYSRKLITGRVTATNGVRNFNNLNIANIGGKNRLDILRTLEANTKFRIIWYILFAILGTVCLILEPKSWFYVLDLFILMVNIDLVTRGKVIGIYIGILECVLYAYIAYLSGLYGEAIKMFLINIPLNIFSIISWTKSYKKEKANTKKYQTEEQSNSIVVRRLNIKNVWLILAIFVGLYVPSFFGLRALGTSVIILSTLSFVLTILTKILNGLRYVESWICDIIASCSNLIMWVIVVVQSINTGFNLIELPVILTTLAILSNSIFAYIMWRIMYRNLVVNNDGYILKKRPLNINKIIKLKRQYQQLRWNREVDEKKNNQ